METKVEQLQHDLDKGKAESKRNYKKGEGYTNRVTRHGHYISNLHAKLDASFTLKKIGVLKASQKSPALVWVVSRTA